MGGTEAADVFGPGIERAAADVVAAAGAQRGPVDGGGHRVLDGVGELLGVAGYDQPAAFALAADDGSGGADV